MSEFDTPNEITEFRTRAEADRFSEWFTIPAKRPLKADRPSIRAAFLDMWLLANPGCCCSFI